MFNSKELIEKEASESAVQIAEIYAYRGEIDKAFEWLDHAYANRDAGLTQIKGVPLYRNIQHDPRWALLLQKMRLPPD